MAENFDKISYKLLQADPMRNKQKEQIQRIKSSNFYIGHDEKVGFFLFSNRNYIKGDIICEYVGIVEKLDNQRETFSFLGHVAVENGEDIGICTD